jgi:hypothetical protein
MNDSELAIAVAQEGAAVVHRCFGSTLQRSTKVGAISPPTRTSQR